MKKILEKVRRMDYWQNDKIGQHGYKKNKRGERKLNLCSDSSDSPELSLKDTRIQGKDIRHLRHPHFQEGSNFERRTRRLSNNNSNNINTHHNSSKTETTTTKQEEEKKKKE